MKTKALVLFLIFLSVICFGQTEKFSVYFKFNKYDLDNTAKSRIDSFIDAKPIQHISLQGHTDYEGNDEYNDELSLKRVAEVRTYLLSKAIKDSAIEIKALGKRKLLNNSRSESEKALNRRVEVEFIVKPKETPPPPKKDSIKTPVVKLSPFEKEVIINGSVWDEYNNPVIAEVTLHDKDGKEILTTTSDAKGKYTIKTILNKKDDYSLTFYNDSLFTSAKKINLSQPRFPYKNLKTVLSHLFVGDKYILENLNFVGDTSQLIAASLPSLEALVRVMQKNTSLVIQIEGHVNYPNWLPNAKRTPHTSKRYAPPGVNAAGFNQWLSDERAKVVMNYLIEKGIDPKRLTSKGFGASQMLFPDAINEAEESQNRRVEIHVIFIK